MSIQEVCRLCLSKDHLVWVFDKRLKKEDHIKDVILITTGVEIHCKDVISQKICTKCCQDAIKMFQFRQKSLTNDRYLKAQCRELLQHTDIKIPNTSITIITEKMKKGATNQEQLRKLPYRVHPTMTALSRKYPHLQFPSICLLFNVDPYISMEMNEVENYFKSRKLNMQKYVRLALRASDKNSPKKASGITKSSEKCSEHTAENKDADCVTPSAPTAVPETIGNAKVVNRVRPINIKLNQSGYSIVRHPMADIVDGQDESDRESTSSCEQFNAGSPGSQSDIRKPKKRRRSSSNSWSEPEIKKVPSANPSNATPVLSSVEKEPPAEFKCTICDSVHSSAKHLKKHQIRHWRCELCKIQFRSLGMKRQHIINSCLVKEAMNNFPNVEIKRVDLDMNVRRDHSGAFVNFPPLPGLEKIDSAPESTKAAVEIIEIMSDDEDTSTASSLPGKPIHATNSAPKTSAVITISHQIPSVSSGIRPDIRLKDDVVLDSLDTQALELKVVEGLLSKIRKLRLVTSQVTQTELPTSESISVNENDVAAELKSLRRILHSYQIPVTIRKGSMSVSYNHQRTPSRTKILKSWSHLTPIDVKTENNVIKHQEYAIPETPVTHPHHTTNSDSAKGKKSCDVSNNNRTSTQNIGFVVPLSAKGSTVSSDRLQTKSPLIPTRNQSPISPSGCSTVAQADTVSTISTHTPLNTRIQEGRKSLSPYSNAQSLESSQVQAMPPIAHIPNRRHTSISPGLGQTTPQITSQSLNISPAQDASPITDIPMRGHPQNASGADQTTPHMNQPLGIYSVQQASLVANTSNGRNVSGTDQNTLQNNSVLIATSCASPCINSEPSRKSPVQIRSPDVRANWNSVNHQLMDYTTVTNQVTQKAAEYGVVDTSDNQHSRLQFSKTGAPKKPIGRSKNAWDNFPKATAGYHTYVPANPNSVIASPGIHGNKAPFQEMTLNNNRSFIQPPPPLSSGSSLLYQRSQLYTSPHTATSNVPRVANTATSLQTESGNSDAFREYISQLREFESWPPTVRTTGAYMPKHVLARAKIPASASNLLCSFTNQSILPSPRASQPFGCHGNASVNLPRRSEGLGGCLNDNAPWDRINHHCDVCEKQFLNACSNSSTVAVFDTLTDSVPPSDKSGHLSGLIRVRNVCELT